MRCKHDWKEVSRVREKSTYEILADIGVSEARTVNIPAYTVIILACSKCGKLKKYRIE